MTRRLSGHYSQKTDLKLDARAAESSSGKKPRMAQRPSWCERRARLKACPSESARPLIQLERLIDLEFPRSLVFSHVVLPARFPGQNQVGKAEKSPKSSAMHPAHPLARAECVFRIERHAGIRPQVLDVIKGVGQSVTVTESQVWWRKSKVFARDHAR